MTFSFIQMYETSQRASSPSMDVATAAEIKVSEVVSAETVIERLIELKSARSTSDLATLGRSPLLRSRCSKTPKFAISDETLSALSCNQDHRELQRKITRRTAQRDAVPIAATCPCRAGSLATRLHEARPDSKLGWTAPPFDESAGRKRECSPSPMAPRARARVCGREGAHASVDVRPTVSTARLLPPRRPLARERAGERRVCSGRPHVQLARLLQGSKIVAHSTSQGGWPCLGVF